MSTGGNVPAQGVVVEAATTEKKRGDRSMGHPNGFVGKGTAGSRLRSAHRKWRKANNDPNRLRHYAKRVAGGDDLAVGAYGGEELRKDAKDWLSRKGITA